MIDGVPRPDHGPDMVERVCADCSASWVGRVDDGCGWCERREERLRADTRAMLLNPPSLRSDAGHPRYDALDDVGKAVWDRTRGQTRGADSIAAWLSRLVRAVEAELITEADARRAIERVTR